MSMVTMTLLLLFVGDGFQVTEVGHKFWSIEQCVEMAEYAAPRIFEEIPTVEEIRYTCEEDS